MAWAQRRDTETVRWQGMGTVYHSTADTEMVRWQGMDTAVPQHSGETQRRHIQLSLHVGLRFHSQPNTTQLCRVHRLVIKNKVYHLVFSLNKQRHLQQFPSASTVFKPFLLQRQTYPSVSWNNGEGVFSSVLCSGLN